MISQPYLKEHQWGGARMGAPNILSLEKCDQMVIAV